MANAIENVVTYIGDLETLTPYLKNLGLQHKKLGVLKDQYIIFTKAILETLKDCLNKDFSKEVE